VGRDPDHSLQSRTEAKGTGAIPLLPNAFSGVDRASYNLGRVPVGTIISLTHTNTDYPFPHINLQITVTDISYFLVKILPSLVTPPAYIKHLHHKHLSYSSSAVIYSPLHSHFELQHANPLTISRLLLPEKPINDASLIYHKYLELPIQKTLQHIAAISNAGVVQESTNEEAEFI